jgi:hypothetical protein
MHNRNYLVVALSLYQSRFRLIQCKYCFEKSRHDTIGSGYLREFAVTDKVGYVEINSKERVVDDDVKE